MYCIFYIFRSTSDIGSCRTLSIFDIIYSGSFSAGKSFLAVNDPFSRKSSSEKKVTSFGQMLWVAAIIILTELKELQCIDALLHGWASVERLRNRVNVNLFLRHIRDLLR